MSSRRFIVAALFTSLSAAAFVSAQPGAGDKPAPSQPANAQPGGPAGPGAGDRQRSARPADGQPESLERLMKSMGRGLRTLKKQADNPEMKNENLQILADMQRVAVQTKTMKPEHLPEKDQEAYLQDYRLQQIDLLGLLLRAERSLLKGDYADAAKAVVEVDALRDSAHKKFAPEEDEHLGLPPARGNTPPAKK